MRHNLQWFIDRIGKTIYRKTLKCKCWCCQSNEIKIRGELIENEQRLTRRETHAKYLHDCQGVYNIEYFDKPIKE